MKLLNKYKNLYAIILLIIIWEITSSIVNEPLIFPHFINVVYAFKYLLFLDKFYFSLWSSISTLFFSYICGIIVSLFFVISAMNSNIFRNFFTQYCLYFSPLPSFVLLPFISLFFGLSLNTIILVIITNIVWQNGYQMLKIFDTVYDQWNLHAKNLKWGSVKSLFYIYIPAATKNLLGLASVAWSNSWRILISMEVVFGSIGGHFGLGSYITDSRTQLNTDRMYATLIVIVGTGFLVNWFLNNLSKR